MAWQIVQNPESCITKNEIDGILSFLPKGLTDDLGRISHEPEGLHKSPRIKLSGMDTHKVRSLGYRQGGVSHLVWSGPERSATDQERLEHAARFLPMFLRQVVARANHVWPDALLDEAAEAMQDATHRGLGRSVDDPRRAGADLFVLAVTTPVDEDDQDVWSQSLANRLAARGMGMDRLAQTVALAEKLGQAAEQGYDLSGSTYGLSNLRQDMVRHWARKVIRQAVLSSAKEAYTRACLLRALLSGHSDDAEAAGDMLPVDLVDRVRGLAIEGNPHQTGAAPRLVQALENLNV
jgi:hypothetical protein